MLAFAALIIGVTHLTNMQAWMLAHYGSALTAPALVAGGLAISGLFLLAVAFRHHVASTPAVLAAGGITYPLYLLHQNIGYVGINAIQPVAGAAAAAILVAAAMLALSWLVWRLGERPGQRRMRTLLEALLDRSAALVAFARSRTA